MKPVCSIVIRAYNEESHIRQLFDGISHQSIKDIQVILVDSGSKDRTKDIALGYGAEIVEISPSEFTFGKSLNLGISRSVAPLVIIASAHIYPVYPDWIEKMLEPFKNKEVGLVFGKQRGDIKSKFSEKQVFNQWYPDESSIRQNNPFCNNANAVIRLDLWQEHPYDENLPALEDLAWAKWLIGKGLCIAYVSEAEIIHVHNETWHGIYNRYRREGMAFKNIYPQEKFSFFEFLQLFFSNCWNDFRIAIKQKIITREFLNIIKFRFNQFWGTYKGYRCSGPLTMQLKRSFYYPKNGKIDFSQIRNRSDIAPISYNTKSIDT